MRDRNDAKAVFGLVLMAISLLAIIGCIIAAFVIRLKNPDMTKMRYMIEYPWTSIVGLIAIAFLWVGKRCMTGKK